MLARVTVFAALIAPAWALQAPRSGAYGDVPLIPGVDALSSGFDAVTGEGNLMPIFAPDTSSMTTFDMPDSNGIQYSVPASVKAAVVDMTQTKTNECLSMEFENYLHTYVSSFGIDVNIGAACFKASASYNKEVGHVKNMTRSGMNAVDLNLFEVVPYKLEALPYFVRKQDSAFSMTIKALPSSIASDSDKQMVTAFINAFGTHFVQEVTCGARLNVDQFVNSNIFNSYSHDWVSTQMSLSFHYEAFDISAGGFANKSDIHLSKDFQKAATSSTTYIGGDESLQTNTTLKAWAASVDRFPVPLNYTITELTTAVQDAGVKSMLEGVYKGYLATGDLPSAIDAVAEQHAARAERGEEPERGPAAKEPTVTYEQFMQLLDDPALRLKKNRRAAARLGLHAKQPVARY